MGLIEIGPQLADALKGVAGMAVFAIVCWVLAR